MNQNPYRHTMLPTHLAKRMIEQRGGTWRIELGPFLEIIHNGEHLGSVLIADGAVKFLDITNALAKAH